MKIKVSSTEYEVIIDTEETNFTEWMINLEAQYPLLNYEEIEEKTK
jgi:hypothetical protein